MNNVNANGFVRSIHAGLIAAAIALMALPMAAQAQQGGAAAKTSEGGSVEESDEASRLNQRECPICGIKFVEFRNSGRLGCPHDYQEFRGELLPLLENIHGETRHCGKAPRRMPRNQQTQSELMQLRNQLKQAVQRENYEEAARIRDRIRKLEEG